MSGEPLDLPPLGEHLLRPGVDFAPEAEHEDEEDEEDGEFEAEEAHARDGNGVVEADGDEKGRHGGEHAGEQGRREEDRLVARVEFELQNLHPPVDRDDGGPGRSIRRYLSLVELAEGDPTKFCCPVINAFLIRDAYRA